MGNGSEKGQREKKPYSNSFRSLEAIWEVLEPESLRREIAQELEEALKTYRS